MRRAMTRIGIVTITACLLCLAGGAIAPSDATTSFNGSTIIGVDQAQRTITFRSQHGENWTLPVADPDILNKQLAQGDRVSIEIDLDDRITKVLKSSGQPQSQDTGLRDDVSQ